MGMFGIFGQGNKAYSTLVSAEKNVQELVASAKTRIVVKSVIVPAANAVSNMFQLLNRGVPLRHIIKGTGAKTAEINFYIKNRKKEIDLEADLRAAQGKNDLVAIPRIENQLKSITDSYRRLTIWPLIEAGEFSAISNGQVTAEDLALADGKWSDWIERKVHDLPAGVNTTARYLLVTRDTSLFQGLARAVQYGDFVAKAILYDDLVKRLVENSQRLNDGGLRAPGSFGAFEIILFAFPAAHGLAVGEVRSHARAKLAPLEHSRVRSIYSSRKHYCAHCRNAGGSRGGEYRNLSHGCDEDPLYSNMRPIHQPLVSLT
jgi:hypothetical protein